MISKIREIIFGKKYIRFEKRLENMVDEVVKARKIQSDAEYRVESLKREVDSLRKKFDENNLERIKYERKYEELLSDLRQQNEADILLTVKRIEAKILSGENEEAKKMKSEQLESLLQRQDLLRGLISQQRSFNYPQLSGGSLFGGLLGRLP